MQKNMRRILSMMLGIGLGMNITTAAWADAPVVNIDPANDITAAPAPAAADQAAVAIPMQTPLTMEQRVKQLEQQLSNFAQMNLPAKLDELRQQVQQLQGQSEEQAHTIQALQDQLNNFYKDVNQRLKPAASTDAPAKVNNTVVGSTPGVLNATPKAAANANASEQTVYQKALDLLMAKKYEPAITAFQGYLQRYPNGLYVVSANYWLGEIYFLKNRFAAASEAFELVIKKNPHDAKVPDAKLKLALIHDNAGQRDQARKELQRIIHDYPNSSAAQLAKLHLKTMTSTLSSGEVQP